MVLNIDPKRGHLYASTGPTVGNVNTSCFHVISHIDMIIIDVIDVFPFMLPLILILWQWLINSIV